MACLALHGETAVGVLLAAPTEKFIALEEVIVVL
jgi:hypothetical protein